MIAVFAVSAALFAEVNRVSTAASESISAFTAVVKSVCASVVEPTTVVSTGVSPALVADVS